MSSEDLTKLSISLDVLSPWNPFDNVVWLGLEVPITKGEVQSAINENKLAAYPLSYYYASSNDNSAKERSHHIQRIAYLATHSWSDAIVIDVGVPELGQHVDWIIIDGNHRLAAAVFRNDKHIVASVSGSISYAKRLLGLS